MPGALVCRETAISRLFHAIPRELSIRGEKAEPGFTHGGVVMAAAEKSRENGGERRETEGRRKFVKTRKRRKLRVSSSRPCLSVDEKQSWIVLMPKPTDHSGARHTTANQMGLDKLNA